MLESTSRSMPIFDNVWYFEKLSTVTTQQNVSQPSFAFPFKEYNLNIDNF